MVSQKFRSTSHASGRPRRRQTSSEYHSGFASSPFLARNAQPRKLCCSDSPHQAEELAWRFPRARYGTAMPARGDPRENVPSRTAIPSFLGAALVLLYRYQPGGLLYPGCWIHALTGLHCPGCGATRALHALLHGQFAQAADFNAFIVLLAPAALVWLLFFLYRALRYNRIRPPVIPGRAVAGGLLAAHDSEKADLPIDHLVDATLPSGGVRAHTNKDATGQVILTLPDPKEEDPNLPYAFCVVAAQNLRIKAAAGHTIRFNRQQSVSGGYVQSSLPGGLSSILPFGDTEWIISSQIGTWIIDD